MDPTQRGQIIQNLIMTEDLAPLIASEGEKARALQHQFSQSNSEPAPEALAAFEAASFTANVAQEIKILRNYDENAPDIDLFETYGGTDPSTLDTAEAAM